MRRLGSWGMAAALIVGLGAAAAVAEEPDGDAKAVSAKSGWWSNWLGEKPKPKAKIEKKPASEDTPAPPHTADMGVVEQKRQMNAVLRRMEVCDRLRMVALQNGNEELMRQADELEARAREVYRQQTAQLPTQARPVEAELKSNEKKFATKPTSGPIGLTGKEYDIETPAAKPVDARSRLSGDFERRERDLINDTFTGRDKP